jgi:flagellar hook assembly protein FlgD
MSIYDLGGRRVRTLVDRMSSPGSFETTWDGRDDRGTELANGVYFLRVIGPEGTTTRRITRVR